MAQMLVSPKVSWYLHSSFISNFQIGKDSAFNWVLDKECTRQDTVLIQKSLMKLEQVQNIHLTDPSHNKINVHRFQMQQRGEHHKSYA
jgi:hypothetical protein